MKKIITLFLFFGILITFLGIYQLFELKTKEISLRSGLSHLKNEHNIDRYYQYVEFFDSCFVKFEQKNMLSIRFGAIVTGISTILLISKLIIDIRNSKKAALSNPDSLRDRNT